MEREKYLIYDFGDGYAREPVIKKIGNTTVCLFLTGGKTEPEIANVVAVSRSFDDGKTWSKPETLYSMKERGCWAPEIFNEDGECFVCLNTYSGTWRKEYYRELQLYRSDTKDGVSFSEPVSFPYGLNGVTLRRGFKMSNGEWLFSAYWSEVTYDFEFCNDSEKELGADRYPFRCGVVVSSDKGKSFRRFGYFRADRSLWEPCTVEFEKGHLICLMRYNGASCLMKTESFDYGRTWSEVSLTDIPNPNSKFVFFTVNGKTYLINNFSTEFGIPKRKNLEIHRFYSDCHTEKVYEIEDGEENWYYPHVIVNYDERKIWVAYENKKQHWLQKIPFKTIGAL